MFGDNTFLCVNRNGNQTLQTHYAEDVNKIPFTVLAVQSNLMLIYGFYKTSRPFTIITKLFIYLSLVDIEFAFNLMIISIILQPFTQYLHIYAIITTSQFLYFVGLDIFATISFLKYWSIKKPLQFMS